MNKNRNFEELIIAVLIPLTVGMLSSLLTQNNMAVYQSLVEPSLNPPGYIFPIVWTILYILMGISSYIIYHSGSPGTSTALTWYGVSLFLNFGWSIIFFGLSQYLLAFVWLLLLIFAIIGMIYQYYKISPTAAYLQIPYLLWCIFAAYLNISIYLLNPAS